MAVKSHLARRERKSQRQLANVLPLFSSQNEPISDLYPAERLACVREILDRIDRMLLREKDAQKIDRLVNAQAKLAEQERILAGRPLPGSYRPGTPRAKPERRGAEPLD